MSQKILTALALLDVGNDAHWTAEGLPRIDTVRLLASDQSLTREDITSAAPTFSRTSPLQAATATDAGNGTGENTGAPATVVNSDASATNTTVTSTEDAGSAQGGSDVEDGEGTTDENGQRIAQLEAELTGAQEKLAQSQLRKSEADRAFEAARSATDEIIQKLESLKRLTPTGDAVRGYLSQQLKHRLERAEKLRELAGNKDALQGLAAVKGILNGKAPIDTVRQRKR